LIYIIKRALFSVRDCFRVEDHSKKIIFRFQRGFLPYFQKMWIIDFDKTKLGYIKRDFLKINRYSLYMNAQKILGIKKVGRFFKTNLEIISDCENYTLQGYIADREFSIYKDEELMAKVSNKFNKWAYVYGVEIEKQIDVEETLKILFIIVSSYMIYGRVRLI